MILVKAGRGGQGEESERGKGRRIVLNRFAAVN